MRRIKVAKTGGAVLFISAFILALEAVLIVAGIFVHESLVPSAALATILAWVFLCWTPVAYVLDGEKLVVLYRIGSKTLLVEGKPHRPELMPRFSIKIWANGGLFAGAGLFWAKNTGLFHAYVTTTRKDKILAIKGRNGRMIFISPQDPEDLAV